MKQLPVVETVRKAVRYTFDNLATMVRLCLSWGAVLLAVMAFAWFTGGSRAVLMFATGAMPDVESGFEMTGIEVVWLIGLLLVYTAAVYSIIVSWHRALLMDEQPASNTFRLDRYAGHYFLRTLALMGLAMLAAFSLVLMGGMIESATEQSVVGTAIGILGIVAVALIMLRLQLALPGAAVGDRRMSFSQSFALTRGNTWRLAGGFVLLVLLQLALFVPLQIAAGLVLGVDVAVVQQAIASGDLSALGFGTLVWVLLAWTAYALAGFLTLSFMSYCYWFFVPPPQPGDLR